MYFQSHKEPEDQLYDALNAVFSLDTPVALGLSKQAVCQIAAFYADVGATEGSEEALDVAIDRIREMQIEIFTLEQHLTEFKNDAQLSLH